jgi:hypothetical protein
MMLDRGACKTVGRQNTASDQWMIAGIVATLFVIIGGGLFPHTAVAQQRVVIDKATGNVVDVGDSELQYDTRYFDHMDFPAAVVPEGENVKKYRRDASGAIVLRPKDELTKTFADERNNDLIARINGSTVSAEMKAILIEIVKATLR